MKIGVLSLQGAISEHIDMFKACGVEAVRVKKPADISQLDGLVIPGGESTTICRLINILGLSEPIKELKERGKPLFGTCAGMVLLGKEIKDTPGQDLLGLMDTTIVRNGFGRQRESFEVEFSVSEVDGDNFRGVFIRAPFIDRAGEGVKVLAEYKDKIIAAQQDNVLAVAFHPELSEDLRFHQYFLSMVPKP